MTPRYDMETEIMNCWGVTSDLDALFEEVIEGEPTQDQIANVLLGMQTLYDIRFRKLFRTFEGMMRERLILTEEKRAEIDRDRLALDNFVAKATDNANALWDEAVAKLETANKPKKKTTTRTKKRKNA